MFSGNKWFGTYNGVSKFDGSNWTTYRFNNTANGLVNNWVNAIIIDAKGDIWFGTSGGCYQNLMVLIGQHILQKMD